MKHLWLILCTATLMLSSCVVGFGDAWVPTISFSGDDKSRINSPGDTIEFINPALLGDAAVLVLDLLVSFEDLQCGCR